jgi:murein DD-endopeptidase MepM/ murein hydrolase activator NlpD
MLKKIAGSLILICVIFMIAYLAKSEEIEINEPELVSIENMSEIPPVPPRDRYGFEYNSYEVVESTIERNESLYIILSRHGVSPERIYQIQKEAAGKINLSRMIPGQEYKLYKGENGEVEAFAWRRSDTDYSVIQWQDEITIENGTIPVDVKISAVSGTIESSLANAIYQQGVSQRLIVELANIYAWTVDFYGLRKGDRFKAVYENRYVDDEYIGIGTIHAAEFVHRGDIKRAYFFDNGEQSGYFDEDGNSLRRAMMRVPFEYNPRISSGFSRSRMHPILNRRRPHFGTDYAAPTGTPILAAGDGVVTEAQRRGGNGNIVQIKHNSVYKTAYLHMSRFGPGIRAGVKVKQGQVIGYVGQTGLATGPHLCYRLYKNNAPVNSVTYDFPPDEGLRAEFMNEFMMEVQRLDQMMDSLIGEGNELALSTNY